MSIGKRSFFKSLAQTSLSTGSRLFATQSTESILLGAGAYLSALRGSGWSPSLEQEARCAVRCLTPGTEFVVIDAGANVGDWLAEFQRIVNAQGRCFAFEPQPAAANMIRKKNLKNCEIIQAALGEEPGTALFFSSVNCDTTASLYERRDSFGGDRNYESFEVNVMRLDDFVETKQIRQIDFMKMDLEGAEFKALKGAAECMRKGLLRAFTFEFGASNVNARVFFRDIYDLLAEYQYGLSRLTPAGRLIRVNGYSEDYECFARTSTYLARRKEYS